MVPFLVVLGFLVFGCAIVAFATRRVWTAEATRRLARPLPARSTGRLPFVAHPEAFADAPNVQNAGHAPVEAATFDGEGALRAVKPIQGYAPAADPSAHAPPLSPGSQTGTRD